ncbi:MAG: tetratricopeptide repeat protein [Anaeromyxobacter sp.]|nr:tetratricopeptide repeat protein [Anaeromyxobacter sp.]MBL0275642.1 tetratricopeptide repeat protein [Anaeromyxobacter sp.]
MDLRRRLPAACLVGVALVGAAWPGAAAAFSNVREGELLENPTLPTLDGGRAALLSGAVTASVFVFFRPQQEHSLDALRELELVRRELAGRPLRFVAVVSGSWPADEVRAAVRAAGLDWPVLVDRDDALYGRLGVRLHPVVGIADRGLRLSSYEHFRQINFRQIVLTRLQVLLGEASPADMARVLDPPRATTGSPEAEARRHLNLARALWRRHNGAQALEYLARSLAAAPSAPAHALRGEVLAAQGRCAQARPAFEAALKIDPAEAVALSGRAACQRQAATPSP